MADSVDPLDADATPDLIREAWEDACINQHMSHNELAKRGEAIKARSDNRRNTTYHAAACPRLVNVSPVNIFNALHNNKPDMRNFVPPSSKSYNDIKAEHGVTTIETVNTKRQVKPEKFWNTSKSVRASKEEKGPIDLSSSPAPIPRKNLPAGNDVKTEVTGDQDPPPANLAGDAAAASLNGSTNVKKEEEEHIDLTRSPSPIRRNDLPSGRNDVKAESLVAAKKGAGDEEEEEEEENIDININALQTFSKKYKTKCKEHEALEKECEELRKQSASKSKARDEEVERLRKKMETIVAEKQKLDEACISLQAEIMQLTRF